MLLLRLAGAILLLGAVVAGIGAAYGQNFPDRPVRIVCSQPGGGSDFSARLIANGITEALGQRVIVDNRAASAIPGEIVAKAPPDGYTLLLDATSFWVGPLLRVTPYDPIRDLAPVTLTDKAPNVLVVNLSDSIKSVKDLIAHAKAHPGQLNYASSGTGGSPHLAVELFKSLAGVDIVRINYKGSGPAVLGLISGEAQVMIGTAASVAPHVKSGKLRMLAVTDPQPSPLFPGLPTIAAAGVPGYDATSIRGILTPAKTPAAIISRLNQEIARALKSAELKEKYASAGLETVGSTPEEFGAAIKSEIVRWGKVIKGAGIKAE